LGGIDTWIAVMAFMWQIYFDFSGYTDIAIGVARLFGFQFDSNFYFPFNVTSISEHWSRWHISFTTWIRDYIYIPLGGSRGSEWMICRNIFITFLFGGVWHGAAYHYVAWGVWHSIMLITERQYARTKIREYLNLHGGYLYFSSCRIFTIFCIGLGLPLFRADSLPSSYIMLNKMLNFQLLISDPIKNYGYLKLIVLLFITGQIFEKYKLKKMMENNRSFTLFILVNFILLLCFSVSEAKNFIYFAF
jgi:D-alanyl-lipoteichoic acid acyltransferase DltB (MBOAT superfamily)